MQTIKEIDDILVEKYGKYMRLEICINKDKDSGAIGTGQNNIIKKVNDDIIIKNGKYGPYISYKKQKNIKLYTKKKIEDLTLEDCEDIIRKYKSISFKTKYNKPSKL